MKRRRSPMLMKASKKDGEVVGGVFEFAGWFWRIGGRNVRKYVEMVGRIGEMEGKCVRVR